MNIKLANLSTDLRRTSYWIYRGKKKLARETMEKLKDKYKDIGSVGIYENIWEEIDKVIKNEGGNMRSADRATTLGSILLQESLK